MTAESDATIRSGRDGADRGRESVGADEGIDLLSLGIVLLRRRGMIAGCAIVLATLVGGIRLAQPRSYTSVATIVPQAPTRGGASGLAGIAAQFGVAVPGGEASQSPTFYASLVKSRGITRAVVNSEYAFDTDSGPVRTTLTALYGADEETEAKREEEAIRQLNDDAEASVMQKTGIVSVAVKARDPELARQITQRIIDEVSRFNLQSRRTQAAAERQFTERRLTEAGADLRRAEGAQVDFALRNRISDAPRLRIEEERLAREVALRQQLYTQLAQAFEQARIDEVRDTPLLTIVEAPERPVKPDPRGVVVSTAIALIFGAFFGVVWAIVREFAANSRSMNGNRFAEFEALRADTIRDFFQPWRPVARMIRGRRRR